MEDPRVYNQPNIGFGAVLGVALLDELPPQPMNMKPVRHHNIVDDSDIPKIQAWVEQCRQKHEHMSAPEQCRLIRQMSGGGVPFHRPDGTLGYDSNDYGAYITDTQKRCHIIFDAFKHSFIQQSSDVSVADVSVADNSKQLISLLQQIDNHFARSAITSCTQGKFCEMWKYLDIAIGGNVHMSQTVGLIKTFAAPLVLSPEHTKMAIEQLSAEFVRLEEYVAQYLHGRSMFNARAWKLMKNWMEKIKELSELERNQGESNGLWQTFFETLPRSRPTKSAAAFAAAAKSAAV
jgi:hypothetical protein